MKTCKTCEVEKAEDLFHKRKLTCKACLKAARRPRSNLPNPALTKQLNDLWRGI